MLRVVFYDRRGHDGEILTHLSSLMKFSSAKFGVVLLTI